MKKQLEELMTQYGPVAELWLDGAWDRRVEDWHLQEVYDHVKKFQPLCQISTNWTIGKRPVDMREGDSIIYFPADFRLWNPFLPVKNDPKVYTYKGKKYRNYPLWSCLYCISQRYENIWKVEHFALLFHKSYKFSSNDFSFLFNSSNSIFLCFIISFLFRCSCIGMYSIR